MCGNCRSEGTIADWFTQWVPTDAAERRKHRSDLARALGRIGAHRRVAVEAPGGFGHLVVRSATGRTESASTLEAACSALEKITGSAIDPLDPDLVKQLEQQSW